MKVTKKRILIAAIIVAVVIAAIAIITLANAGDGKPVPTPESTPTPIPVSTPVPTPTPTPRPTPTPNPTPIPTPTPYDGPVNPLTGLPTATDISKKRPVAIMLNNRKVAQPQLGVSQADVLYEAPVEGGITRMLGVYQDASDVGVIGSVRSARLYYLDIAQGYDAIYIHAGGSPQAYIALKSRGATHVDGVNGPHQEIFYRDAERRRTMGYEHSMVTTGALIAQYLPTYKFRLDHDADYAYAPVFDPDFALPGGGARSISVSFSSLKSTSMAYHEPDGLYYLSQHGGAYVDGNDGVQVTAANVLVLKAAIGQISGDTEGRLDVSLVGSGTGYYAAGGGYAPIKWSKKSVTDPFVYTYEDGRELTFRTGRTYVGIVAKSVEPVFSSEVTS